jgi:cyclic beta-1,2-glucan synthetase
MPDNTHLDIMIAEQERHHEPAGEALDSQVLRDAGAQFAAQLGWLPGTPASSTFRERCRRLASALKPLFAAVEATASHAPVSDDFRWLRDNIPLVYSEMRNVATELKPLRRLPHARARRGEIVPRVLAFAQAFLDVADNSFNEQGFTSFCQAFQETTILDLRELRALVPALKLILLERIAARGRCLVKDPTSDAFAVGACIRSLRDVTHASWKDVLEPLVRFDEIFRQDPAGAYPHMDFESRDLYRDRLSKIARHSDLTEMEVAREALALAQLAGGKTYRDARVAQRESHIGFYLVGKGIAALYQRVGFMPSFVQKLRDSLRRHPDEFFLPGIAILTFAIITGILLFLTPRESTPALVLLSMLFLLLPSSQSAVQVMNYLVTTLLPAQILPKVDFSDGIPADCVTLVAVPTLLLNEKQVRTLVEDLEVRFLGNHDPQSARKRLDGMGTQAR